MRNPKRISRILEKICELWRMHPDQRLGQLLINVERGAGTGTDLWNVEDNVWEKKLDDVIRNGFGDESKRVQKLVSELSCAFLDDMNVDIGKTLNEIHDKVVASDNKENGYQALFQILTEEWSGEDA